MIATNAECALWRPELEGMSHGILPWYRSVVPSLPSDAWCLEIGNFFGRSLIFLAEELKKAGKVDAFVCGVDPGEVDEAERYPFDNSAVGHAVKDILRGNVSRYQPACVPISLLTCRSHDAAPKLRGCSWDLVFVDGDHRGPAVRDDIETWAPRIRPGGWISGHDYNHADFPDVKAVVDEIYGSRVQLIGEPGDGVWAVRL